MIICRCLTIYQEGQEFVTLLSECANFSFAFNKFLNKW